MDSSLSSGTKLGRYEIRSKIGEGGMGKVYLAQDLELDRRVALKILLDRLASDPQRMQRFVQEARAVSALNHPNILTIHEIGKHQGTRFIATEYIDGETLRARLLDKRLLLSAALEIAIQTAAALVAAHEAGIVHRDIKPENIMLRRDGLVKVLDFGLAKLTDEPVIDVETEATTRAFIKTEPGKVMGTANYMSPEQARGLGVDARTDIFSLGIVIYEMVAGRKPFEGETTLDVLTKILHVEPPLLEDHLRDAPPELEHFVRKALRKDREERYQTARDLLIDLKDFKHGLDLQAQMDRKVSREPRAGAITDGRETAVAETMPAQAKQTDADKTTQTTTTAYLANQIRNHPRSTALALFVFLIAALGLSSYFYVKHNRSALALTNKDTVLLADFVNTTGDAVFDGTLKQGLAVQLQQSPFLNIFPDARGRETLRLMGRSPDERVTELVAREICQRQGLKAFISGSIASLGNNYVIALKAINAQTGDEMAREQVEAGSKEQVLKALGEAASRIREKLGESLASIQKFDASVMVTTTSLEALKAYSAAYDLYLRGKFLESIPFYKRAVELDPNFAYAYMALAVTYGNTGQPGLAAENSAKAFALRDRVSELEKFRISEFYYQFVTGEIDKQIEVLKLHQQAYPRDFDAPANLSNCYLGTGQFGNAVAAAREGQAINPNSIVSQANLGEAFINLNQFAEAKEIFEQLIQRFDDAEVRTRLFRIAFASRDTAAMQRQLDWASGKPDEYVALDWQTSTAAFAGQWQKTQDLSRRSIELATHSDAKEVAAGYAAEQALRAAVFGQFALAKTSAMQSLALVRNQVTLARSALALALAGDEVQARALTEELVKRYAKDTFINELWLPLIRAAVEMQHGNAAKAIELLEGARRYQPAAEFWPQYIRGLAYLKLEKGTEAAAEFRQIIDHRGEAPLSALYPLAQLGLARGAKLSGDTTKARKAYQDFFALWKDADLDISILIEAKKEYAGLK